LYLTQLQGLTPKPPHQAHGKLGTGASGIDHAPLDEQVLGLGLGLVVRARARARARVRARARARARVRARARFRIRVRPSAQP
jgi:hypothetical protein